MKKVIFFIMSIGCAAAVEDPNVTNNTNTQTQTPQTTQTSQTSGSPSSNTTTSEKSALPVPAQWGYEIVGTQGSSLSPEFVTDATLKVKFNGGPGTLKIRFDNGNERTDQYSCIRYKFSLWIDGSEITSLNTQILKSNIVSPMSTCGSNPSEEIVDLSAYMAGRGNTKISLKVKEVATDHGCLIGNYWMCYTVSPLLDTGRGQLFSGNLWVETSLTKPF